MIIYQIIMTNIMHIRNLSPYCNTKKKYNTLFSTKNLKYQFQHTYTQIIIKLNLKMKGYGFPQTFSNNTRYNGYYRANTDSYKKQLMLYLQLSQKYWHDQNQGHQEESLIYLKKATSHLQFIIENETISQVKKSYQDKLYQLKYRLRNRVELRNKQNGCKKIQEKVNKQSFTEKNQISMAMFVGHSNIKWEKIIGQNQVQKQLTEAFIIPLHFPDLYAQNRKKLSSLLLYGPSENGKSLIAKACATQFKGTILTILGDQLANKYYAHSQQIIKDLFGIAKMKKPTLIIIDNFDEIFSSKKIDKAKEELLLQMKDTDKKYSDCFILAISNEPWVIDSAFKKIFFKFTYVALPDYEARVEMIKRLIKYDHRQLALTNLQINGIAERTTNFTFKDLSNLIKQALYEPVRQLQTAKKFKLVNGKYTPCQSGQDGQYKTLQQLKSNQIKVRDCVYKDFEAALKTVKPQIDLNKLKIYEQFAKKHGKQH